jgi:modulator of FtsH protease HflK
MSWNEPGGDNKDPWSGQNQRKGPPDLDEVIQSMQEKLGGLFGGGRGGGVGSPMKAFGIIVLVLLIIWGLSGIYIVNEGNRGVVTRFGAYSETTQPGPHWHVPVPIEAVDIVNVEQQRFFEVGYRSSGGQQTLGSVPREALMLTKDENIVDVRLAVQYQVKDAKNFLFNVMDPAATLKQVTESAERGVVGSNTMDFVLTEGRAEVVAEIKKDIQKIMDDYKAGISVTSVNLQNAQPPEEVQSAFEDAIKAREDKQRLINEAEAYSNDVIPKARGAAARQIQESEGYKAKVVARAQGESSRFTQLLTEYQKAPEVTRKRLYIDAIESVLSETDTVLIDVKGSNNLLYLPLDKIVSRPSAAPSAAAADRAKYSTSQGSHQSTATKPVRQSTRGREGRDR